MNFLHTDLAAAVLLQKGDLTGFTFLLSTIAMFGASVFFLFERGQVPDRWKTSLLVAALVTLIASVNYAFMSTLWINTGVSPDEFRYLDWFLTVPLICLQFYLLLEASGAQPGRGMLWRLVLASVWMLALGYVGQVVQPDQSVLWGALSTVGYAVILFEISVGEAKQLSKSGPAEQIKRTFDLLFWFIFVGWAIYPLGYMTMPGNLLGSLHATLHINVVYNLGDAVNKIGFGLAVWHLARSRNRASARTTTAAGGSSIAPAGPLGTPDPQGL